MRFKNYLNNIDEIHRWSYAEIEKHAKDQEEKEKNKKITKKKR